MLLCVSGSALRLVPERSGACRQARSKVASVIPTAWQERLFPRCGWFWVSAAGVPEPRLLEAVRLHCLPEQDFWRVLRRLSACQRSGDAPTCEARDVPAGFRECLQFVVRARREQFGLSGDQSKSIHETAAHAKRAGSSATLGNEQAGSIVVSGELHCLDKLDKYISSTSPESLVQQSLTVWLKRKSRKQEDI